MSAFRSTVHLMCPLATLQRILLAHIYAHAITKPTNNSTILQANATVKVDTERVKMEPTAKVNSFTSLSCIYQ